MNRFLLFLLISISGIATVAAQATCRVGLRGGINRASTTLASTSNSTANYQATYSATKSAFYAGQIGAVLEIAFRRFALQPALIFSQKGEQFDTYTSIGGVAGMSTQKTQATSRPNWLELPVNMLYTLHGFQVFAGPYVALAVGGRRHGTSWSAAPNVRYAPYDFDEKISFESTSPNRRFDAGANFGLGYRQGPLQVQLGYQLGLRNLHQKDTSDLDNRIDYVHNFSEDAAYNRLVQLTGTYFFSL